jgi:2-haloacid dehalogenase
MTQLNDFRVLSFDCYGTMIDWETGIIDQLRPWVDAHGVRLSDVDLLEGFGHSESAQEAETPQALYPSILEGVHHQLATRWGMPHDEKTAVRFGESVGSWPAFSDSADALARLKERYRLVILSNVDRKSFAASNKKLDVEFDAVYTAEDIGSYKPDPRNFAYLLESERAAGHQPGDILHVGQSLFHDHVPAEAAGLATCWIQRPSPAGSHGAAQPPEHPPDVTFRYRSLAELAEAAGL